VQRHRLAVREPRAAARRLRCHAPARLRGGADEHADVEAVARERRDGLLLRLPDDGRDERPFVTAVVEDEEPDEEPGDGEDPEQGEPRPDVVDEQARRPGIGRRDRLRRDRSVRLGDVGVARDDGLCPEARRKIPAKRASRFLGRAAGRSPPGPLLLSCRAMFARETKPTPLADGVVRLGTDKVNWYLLADESGVTIVDCAMPAYYEQLDAGLASLGRSRGDVRAIILTHGHADHVGFAERARSELGVPVHVHRDDESLTTTGKAFGKSEKGMPAYLRYPYAYAFLAHLATAGGKATPVQAVTTFGEDGTLDVPGRPRAIHTPGHTSGHTVFYLEPTRTLLLGDLLCTLNPLTGGRGPQLLPQAFNLSSATMLDSLSKLEDLDVQTIGFGHGEPWTEGIGEAVRRARATGPT
jgi:glyoxylase-like metal-dependent hydrolase (beta-lactamase superfamily II)